MQPKAVGDLVHLPARTAVARFFDSANHGVLRRLLLVATPIALVAVLVFGARGDLWSASAWLPVLVLTAWILFGGSTALFERTLRHATMLYLALLVLATAVTIPEPRAGYAFVGYVVPGLLVLFRLRLVEYLLLVTIDAGAVAWCLFRPGMPEAPGTKAGMAAGAILVMAIVVAVAMALTRGGRESFLARWRYEVARERDRSRMRSELEDAREIQLSMLPVGSPALDWLDFASASLPATEVGGDYFDYFELSGRRLAVVIGDVAGHGVASGLVLSGVRSGLYLLREELGRPVEVLRKLDRMLRETVGGRVFVTFQIAVLDPALGRVTVANAGHPPLFLVSAAGRISRLGADGLPLGTRLRGEFSEENEKLDEGGMILLFSDGVPELRNLHGEGYGEDRLRQELARARDQAGARRVRDSLLNSLARFKGDVEQADDLTLVVLKIGGAGGPA